MGTTEAHGNAEALARPHGDIRAELARALQQGERQQVGGDDREATGILDAGDDGRRVPDATGGPGVLHEDAEGVGQVTVE